MRRLWARVNRAPHQPLPELDLRHDLPQGLRDGRQVLHFRPACSGRVVSLSCCNTAMWSLCKCTGQAMM